MKKRILSAFLAFCVLLTLCPATTRAATIVASGPCGAENEADLIWTLDENGLLTFVGSGAMKDYDVALAANGDDYTTAPWLPYESQIKSVEIPSGVTHVGRRAFHASFTYGDVWDYYGFESLASVTLADSVESIGDGAFTGCRGLTTVTLSNRLTSIGESAFSYCSALEPLTIPGSVKEIGKNAFSCCSKLANIDLKEGVASIGANAFAYSALETLTIPGSVSEIGSDAFFYCRALIDVDLKEGIASIGARAFSDCAALETLNIPGSVTEIGESAFANCPNLTVNVYSGSYGERYCLLNSVRHKAIDPNTYTITFHPNGGDGEPTTKTMTGLDDVYGEMPTPTRDGYAFMGWHTATEYGDKITSETEFAPRQDQTLYAVWSKMYVITFDPNGGEVSPTSKTLTDADTAYGELPTPSRDGYTFEGWHTATEYGTLVTADTEFADKRNQTLYAVWKEIKATYEVTLKANGGTVEPSSVTVEEGGVYGALPEPSRNGCAFLGWFTEPSGGTQVTAETEVRLTANQSLYAHWIATNAPEFSSNGTAVTDVREMSSESELEGAFTVPDAENPDEFLTATAFCVLYDSAGRMVHLQSWEVDVSDTRNIRFTGSVRIPEGAQVSEIKVIVLSDELVPLQAAGTL